MFRQWSREGEAFRSRHGGIDLAYGSGRFETFDLYRPTGTNAAPIFVFVHGGYWQASDKVQHAQFAQGLLDAGYAVAMPNYGLAPDTPLEASIAQSVAALNFLAREAEALGLDPARLHVSGHSAGAHLAAMALCARDIPPVASALLLSGLYDLRPLGHLPLGRLLGLDDRTRATLLSPAARSRPKLARLAFAVGEGESDAFKAQSAALAQRWQAPPPLVCPGHHFSMLDGLNGGALLDLALTTAKGSRRSKPTSRCASPWSAGAPSADASLRYWQSATTAPPSPSWPSASRNPASALDIPAGARLITDPQDLATLDLDLVVEAAGREAVGIWGEAALRHAPAFAVASTSAFCDDALLDRLVATAERHGSQILIPPGALAGIDGIAAASLLPLDEVVHRIVKPPAAWRGTAAESLVALDALTEATAFFTGTAREAATRFPQNANVAVISALAGIGLDRTRVELVADPAASGNGHQLHASGAFGKLDIAIENRPLATNPKSSEMTALGLVRLIENRVRTLVR